MRAASHFVGLGKGAMPPLLEEVGGAAADEAGEVEGVGEEAGGVGDVIGIHVEGVVDDGPVAADG